MSTTSTTGLSLFPPIQQVEKRREELDALIQKSIESRPARTFISTRRASSRSRTRTPQDTITRASESHEPQKHVVTQQDRISVNNHHHHNNNNNHTEPNPEFNPEVVKTDPLPSVPPNMSNPNRGLNRSPAKRPLVRNPSKASLMSNVSARSSFSPTTASTNNTNNYNNYTNNNNNLTSHFSAATMDTQYTQYTQYTPHQSVYRDSANPHMSKSQEQLAQDNMTVSRNPYSFNRHMSQSIDAIATESPPRASSRSSTLPISLNGYEDSQSYMSHAPSIRRNPYGASRRPSQGDEPPVIPPRSLSRTRLQKNTSDLPFRNPDNAILPNHDNIPTYPTKTRIESSSGTESSNSTNSSRVNSLYTNPEDFYKSPIEKPKPLNLQLQQAAIPPPPPRSPRPAEPTQVLPPSYEYNVPPGHTSYLASRPAPAPPIEKNKDSFSDKPDINSRYAKLSSKEDLMNLWAVSMGNITQNTQSPYNLKVFRQENLRDSKRTRLAFGPTPDDIFYTLNHQRPPPGSDEDHPHETLLLRRHPSSIAPTSSMNGEGLTSPAPAPPAQSQDDLLPISHLQILPPPPPSLSRTKARAMSEFPTEPATHITTVTPVLATLHALESAANTSAAMHLAKVDPEAKSPAAARMAERAVQAASERESVQITWTQSDPLVGRYEMHHTSLGVFEVVVEGSVKAAVEGSGPVRAGTAVSILNPFASVSAQQDASSPLKSPLKSPSLMAAALASPRLPVEMEQEGLLARLDFSRGVLHLDVPAIQALGNIYLVDICVSTLLAVAISEAGRGVDPGLNFAAPPTSLVLAKKSSRRIFGASASNVVGSNSEANRSTVSLVTLRRGMKKRNTIQTIDWTNASAVMGIDHLIGNEDLPRITRGILSVLGLGFKSALWLLEFGVKISARMVIGLSKLGDKA